MAVFNKIDMCRRGLLGFSILAIVLTIGVGFLLWQATELSSVSKISDRIEQIKPMASGIRLVLIGLLGVFWPRLVHLAHSLGRIDQEKRESLLALRWRVVGWLLVIELMLGQNLFGRFFAVTNGSIA
ncbi:MAG: hypothetical protein H6963_12610 [Chromatiaceae bacterium]|nr:hypothetical protein [Chromatiaceae bacterium]